jgi:flavin reductase (DIM6/NTAB) family NADH-FMN oxidoreductase RutF
MSSDHGDVAKALASNEPDRFASIAWTASDRGAVFVHGSPLWLECVPFSEVRAGDHTIALLRVVAMATQPDVPPIVFHRSRFHTLTAP